VGQQCILLNTHEYGTGVLVLTVLLRSEVMVFVNRVLRGISGSKRDEVAGVEKTT
jgi:hypothetical protein